MESPQIHGGPNNNHDKSPGGRQARQKQQTLTERDAQASNEQGLVVKHKRRAKHGSRKVTPETEKGVGDTCGIPQESGGQAKCQKEQVTLSNQVYCW